MFGFLGAVGFCRQHHLHGLGFANLARQALAHAPHRGEGPFGVRVGKFTIVAGQYQVARQGQFQRSRITMAVHRTDDRLRQAGQFFDDTGLEVRSRQLLAGADVFEVMTGGKTLAGAAHHHATDAVQLRGELVHMGLQGQKNLNVQGVQFIRSIDGEYRDAIHVFT